MSSRSNRIVRRAIGSIWRRRQVRWPLCRSIKVVWNAVHWSVQVQVSDFFPSLDGIYWITLHRIYAYIIYIHIYISFSLRIFHLAAAIILPLIILLLYHSCTYYITFDFLPHTFAFCVFASRKKKKRNDDRKLPSSNKYPSFFMIVSLYHLFV